MRIERWIARIALPVLVASVGGVAMAGPASAASTSVYGSGTSTSWYEANLQAQRQIDADCAARGGSVVPYSLQVTLSQRSGDGIGAVYSNTVVGICALPG